MIDAIFLIENTAGTRQVDLLAYLDGAADERAAADALAWIKDLRRARVDGQSLRQRFTFRGDSLWWFAELYLHKQQVVVHLFRGIAALQALIDRERPASIQFVRGGYLARGLAPQVAAARGVSYKGPRTFGRALTVRLAAIEARATALNAASLASRLLRGAMAGRPRPTRAVAFVHRAFWRADSGEGSAEAYIGPVLAALEQRLPSDDLAYVSLGPASNFRARRWWHPLRTGSNASSAPAIEAFAPRAALAPSRAVWRDRHRFRRALWSSDDLRQRAIIGGCDCWSVIREELAGIALLQWPWSAKTMDEAAAALDALQPRVAITYAEAGGWGRALILECRRRGIPSIGLQHGFIYRHWLNYLHEPDEIACDPEQPSDRGFPIPTQTLLFDDYAAQHLVDRGRFPATALKVTGSPRLDALAAEVGKRSPASGAEALVLVATKYREARRVLPALIEAAATVPGVRVAIKTHPAETPDAYAGVASGRSHVTVLDASTPLAPLLRACRGLITVNSTMALDAAVLDIPALVIGLPNNLSPFVDAGIMIGLNEAAAPSEIAGALQRFLYDEELRGELARARASFLTRFNIRADGHAAERSAAAILSTAT